MISSGQTSMRNHDAFRTPGRAGGEDEISKTIGLMFDLRIVFALARNLIPVFVETEHSSATLGKSCNQMLLCEQPWCTCLGEHISDALPRITWVERHIRAA